MQTKEFVVRIVTDLDPGTTEREVGKLLRQEPRFLAQYVSMASEPGTYQAKATPEPMFGGLPKFGEVLPNGATVIEAREADEICYIVLCRTHVSGQYATWAMRRDDGVTVHGHYNRDLGEAFADFKTRR